MRKLTKRKSKNLKLPAPPPVISVHFDGALGAEVGFEDVLQTLGGVDVHVQSRRFVQHLRIRVQHSQRHRLLLQLLLVLELKPKRL